MRVNQYLEKIIVAVLLLVRWQSGSLSAGELEHETQQMIVVLARGDQNDEVLGRIVQIGLESSMAQDSLFQMLENGTWQTAAAKALIALNAEAMPTLRKALQQEGGEIRVVVAEAVSEMGRDAEPLVPDLIRLLENDDQYVRSVVIETLGELRLSSPSILSVLEKSLLSEEESEVASAVNSLAKIGRDAKQVVPTLTKIAGAHRDPGVRYGAIEALLAIGAPDEVVPVLTQALSDPGVIGGFMGSASVEDIAIEGLAKLAHPAPLSVPPLIECLKEHRDPSGWIKPCSILSESASIEAIPFLKRVIEPPYSKDSDRQRFRFSPPKYDFTVRRANALAALARLDRDNRKWITQLKEILDDEKWSVVEDGTENGFLVDLRSIAARGLGKLGKDAVWTLPSLNKAMKTASPSGTSHSLTAAWAVARLDPENRDCIPVLIPAWKISPRLWRSPFHGETPESVVKILGDRAGELFRQIAPLAKEKGDSWDSWDEQFVAKVLVLGEPSVIRTYVAELFIELERGGVDRGAEWRVLDHLGPKTHPALNVMLSSLTSKQHHVRAAAAYRIGLIGPRAESAIPNLKARLLDERVIVRLRAAQALGSIGSASEDAVGALKLVSSDPYRSVREAAANAITAIQSNE